ncbi:serine/threonine-protein kinase [Actinomadura algeriensis]|uniref:non-specific serine/threonine protein kinase n=1 Tax=Actinomadura algeriensis TaxID=1679523 RepID=A0ABR9JPM7_9ACTN|nr:serine/threonine-protein kinase [Actinomadura algeriensis]MBE1532453.1 serine/threonine protein kinase [Actinomadura algeriensis]
MTMLLGRYRLVRELGRGGMGVVWAARDEVMRRDVAIKELLLPDGVGDERRRKLVERAVREARAASRLRHPGIVRVHDVLTADDRPWIVMELMSGHGLDTEIRDKVRLPPEQVRAVALAVVRALRAAHAQGVVHRDVKPANVFLCDDGRVVLADFGIASLDDEERMTRTGLPIGTPGYVAPERMRGHGRAEPASDLFSLGVAMYAALTGRAPFRRESAMASFGAVLTDRPDRPPAPPRLAGLVMGLLEKDPARRIDAERAEELLADPHVLDAAAVDREAPRWHRPAAVGIAVLCVVLPLSQVRGCGTGEEAVPPVAPRTSTPVTPTPTPTPVASTSAPETPESSPTTPWLGPGFTLSPPVPSITLPPCILEGTC